MNFFRKILSKTSTEVNTDNLIASSFIYEGTKGDVSNMKSIYMIFYFIFSITFLPDDLNYFRLTEIL